MIPQEEIDRINAENPPIEVVLRHNLEPKKRALHCPFHSEKTPSFYIYADHAHCYGCGWNGDSIKLEADLSGLSFPDACRKLGASESETPEDEAERLKRIEERRQRQEQAEAERRRENKAKRSLWPQLCYGRTHDLEELAESRVKSGKPKLDYAGPWRAQELGHLHFATWRGRLAWIVADDTTATARRLDGEPWQHRGKSDRMPGSENHPIGLTQSPLPAILVEGEPAYLATLAKLWRTGQHDSRQAVCMLGAGAKLGDHASMLAGRDVVIYADGNEVGIKGARRWEDEATRAGAKSVIIRPLPPGEDVDDLTGKETAE